MMPGALVDKLKAGGLPVGQVIVFTAETDSNHILGRPHQYTGKATWQDTRVTNGLPWPDISDGGSVETFATVDDLQTRATYLAGVTKNPMFAEYEYTSVSGLVILRVSGELTPDQAKQYMQAVQALYPDLK
jgi:hypothetical protein